MSSLFKQTTTYAPVFALLNAETEEIRDRLTKEWKDEKIQELNFIGIVGALLASVLTSTGDWPTVLPNGTRTPWTVRACWYCGLIISLAAVVTAAQQAIRLHRLSCHPQPFTCIRRLLSSERTAADGSALPRRAQIWAWQLSGWLLIASTVCMLGGLMILIWSSTPTRTQSQYSTWWNNDSKLAVTFTIVAVAVVALVLGQQWTLYSWKGADDSDQTRSRAGAKRES